MSSQIRSGGSNWGLWLFSASGIAGLIVGLWIAFAPDSLSQRFTSGEGPIAARVNGVPITMLEFEMAAQAVQSDRRNVLGPGEAERVLDTLINEELLAQEAVRLGLPSSDREVRSAAVRGVMRLILSDLSSVEPSDTVLRAFYEDNSDLFVRPARVRVRHLEVGASDQTAVLGISEALRSGSDFSEIRERFPQVSNRPVPDQLIRAEDLRQYLGGSLPAYALAADEGTILGPIILDDRAHFLWVVEREEGDRPSFESVRDDLENEWRRRAEEDAVNAYIDRLRSRSAIEIDVEQE